MSHGVTVPDIIAATAAHYRISIADLKGERRSQVFARPRQVAMVLAYPIVMSTPRVGRYFNRDHSTVHHATAALKAKPPKPFAFYEITIYARQFAAERRIRTRALVREFKHTGSAILREVAG